MKQITHLCYSVKDGALFCIIQNTATNHGNTLEAIDALIEFKAAFADIAKVTEADIASTSLDSPKYAVPITALFVKVPLNSIDPFETITTPLSMKEFCGIS